MIGATLERLAELALRRDLLLISDEIYEKILYDGATHTSIASLGPEVAARTVVINGVSKAYAMTGWRIGYAAGPKDLLTAMANIQSQSTSNPCSISQKAAVVALREGDAFTEKMVAEFDRRRRVMVERLNAMPGVHCRMPTGAFYAFPNVSGLLGKQGPSGTIHHSDRSCKLPVAGIQGRGGSRRAVWEHPAYSTVVCDQHGDDRSWNGSPRCRIQATYLAMRKKTVISVCKVHLVCVVHPGS